MKKLLVLAVSMGLTAAAMAGGGSMGSGSSGPAYQRPDPGAAPEYPTRPGSYAAGDQSYMPDYSRSGSGYGFGSQQGAPGPGSGYPMYGSGMPDYSGGQQAGRQGQPEPQAMPYGGYTSPYGAGQAMPGAMPGYAGQQAETGVQGGQWPGYGYGPGMPPYGYPPYGYGMPGYPGAPGSQAGGQQGEGPAGQEYGASQAPGTPDAQWGQGAPWYGWPGAGPEGSQGGQQGPGYGYGSGSPQLSRGGMYGYRSPYGIEMNQTDEGYEFLVPLKGVPSEEVTVEVRGRQLVIARDERLSRQTERPGSQGYSRSYSYSFGTFRRSLTIPRDADPSGLTYEATDDGIRIFLPRQQ